MRKQTDTERYAQPLPEISGRHYKPKGRGTYVTMGSYDDPPRDWHASTPVQGDRSGKLRWFWLFLAGALLALMSVSQGLV